MEEQFQEIALGDGYSQTIRNGINSHQETWNVPFEGLTPIEARELKLLIELLGGGDTVIWQSPIGIGDEHWQVKSHSAKPSQGGGHYWDYSMTLVKRYR